MESTKHQNNKITFFFKSCKYNLANTPTIKIPANTFDWQELDPVVFSLQL